MIFDFVVRRLHFLSALPFAPQCFDAALLVRTALFNRERLCAIELLEMEALRIPDVHVCSHRYGGIGFKYKNREFAHVHGNGLFDVELTRERADALVESKRALPHHVLGRSRWVSFWLMSEGDVPCALEILRGALAVGVIHSEAVKGHGLGIYEQQIFETKCGARCLLG